MDPNYYVTTLTNAFHKLAPVAIYLVVGFFLFIKLPFWLMSKVVSSNRDPYQGIDPAKLEKYDAFIERIHLSDGEPKKQEKPQSNSRPKMEKPKQEQKTSEQREPKKKETPKLTSDEKIFQLSAGEILSKSELKKKYHELLKIHHPDKVSALGPEYKKIAEIKTKEINAAYQRLKSKVA